MVEVGSFLSLTFLLVCRGGLPLCDYCACVWCVPAEGEIGSTQNPWGRQGPPGLKPDRSPWWDSLLKRHPTRMFPLYSQNKPESFPLHWRNFGFFWGSFCLNKIDRLLKSLKAEVEGGETKLVCQEPHWTTIFLAAMKITITCMVIENVIQLILTSLLLYGIIHVSLNLNFTGIGKILRLKLMNLS